MFLQDLLRLWAVTLEDIFLPYLQSPLLLGPAILNVLNWEEESLPLSQERSYLYLSNRSTPVPMVPSLLTESKELKEMAVPVSLQKHGALTDSRDIIIRLVITLPGTPGIDSHGATMTDGSFLIGALGTPMTGARTPLRSHITPPPLVNWLHPCTKRRN